MGLGRKHMEREVLEVMSCASQESINPNLSRWKGEPVLKKTRACLQDGHGEQPSSDANAHGLPGWVRCWKALLGGAVAIYQLSQNSTDAYGSASVEQSECFSSPDEERARRR